MTQQLTLRTLLEAACKTGTVTFAAGQAEATITVGLVGDNLLEANEGFGVSLTGFSGNPLGHTFGNQNAIGEIVNDDGQTPVLPNGFSADMFGDPHIVTLDGLGYDFQAVGEFTLVQSTQDDLPLDVQVRTAPAPGSDLVSVITAMATDMGVSPETEAPAKLMIDVLGDPVLSVNGVELLIPPTGADPVDVGEGQVFFDGGAYTIVYGSGEALIVDTFEGFLNVSVFLFNQDGEDGAPTRAAGTIAGIMGNADGLIENDFFLRKRRSNT